MSGPSIGHTIGHNQGPSMEKGRAWRRICWSKSRAALLPKMPIEIIRSRVKRARELGLDYKTYASVRATSGRDVIAFLYSSNALDLRRSVVELPMTKAENLRVMKRCDQLIAAHRPLAVDTLASDFQDTHSIAIRRAISAPLFTHSWGQIRSQMQDLARTEKIPPDGIVLVGDTAFEREWLAAGKFAAYIPAETFFSYQSGAL